MLVSVIIVNYRVKYFLEQTLLSAREALHGIESEIIVVDNNSADDSIAYLKERFHDVTFIENTENVGFARANNQGIFNATGEYTLILNPDTIIGERTVHDCIDWMNSHTDCGAIGVKMMDGNGKFLPESKRSFPTPWASFCKIFGLSKLFPRSPRFASYHLRYYTLDEPHSVDILSGAFIFVRSEIIKAIGGFDEDFFMYGEDIDLSYRIKQRGYANYYIPTPMIHYKGESTKKDSIRYVKVFYEAMIIFMKKHYAHYSTAFSTAIKTGIWLRAAIDASKRILMKPFRCLNIETVTVSTHWAILSKQPDEIMEFFKTARHSNFPASPVNESKVADFVMKNPSCDILIDDSSFNYQQIIGIIEKYGHLHANFHIFSARNRIIISPKMEQI